MIIYRVENANKQGPYAIEAVDIYEASLHQPAPWEDGLPHDSWMYQQMRFGFASIQAYFNWFSTRQERDALASCDCYLSIYEVLPEDTLLGKLQLVFNPEKASLVQTISLKKLNSFM